MAFLKTFRFWFVFSFVQPTEIEMKHTLIANRWRTPDGTLLWSRHRHDYVDYNDSNGEYYFVDGGCDYIRMSRNLFPMRDECVYADDPFETVRACEYRGALVHPDGCPPYHVFVPIRCMSDAHLCNTVAYVLKIMGDVKYDIHLHLYVKELLYRLEHCKFLGDRDYTKMDLESEPEYETVAMQLCTETPETCEFNPDDIVSIMERNSSSAELVHSGETKTVLLFLDSELEKLGKVG